MRTSPFSLLLGAGGALILGALFHFRVLPFLKPDTIVSGGKQIATVELAGFMSRLFFIFAALCFAGSVGWFLARGRPR